MGGRAGRLPIRLGPARTWYPGPIHQVRPGQPGEVPRIAARDAAPVGDGGGPNGDVPVVNQETLRLRGCLLLAKHLRRRLPPALPAEHPLPSLEFCGHEVALPGILSRPPGGQGRRKESNFLITKAPGYNKTFT